MSRPYERLWSLIAAAFPKAGAFKKHVDKLSGPDLVTLYADCIAASDEVRPKYEGPFVPELDGCLSEDDMEDLTDWILGQGYDVWLKARAADDAALVAQYQAMQAERDGDGGRWKGETPPIAPAFFGSYARRFDQKQFLDLVEAELDSRVGR